MQRTIALSALLVAALVAPSGVRAAVAPPDAPDGDADAAAPKVVLIVGPVGSVTDRYRALAEEAARIAERHTPNVVRVYSPNATWPAVRSALDGASIVVYLGHGNGWPSRYRDELFPTSQNGFGLNPVDGGGDGSHQYFGERYVDDARLAPNAVILLHHLCYASGNTEPGLPEGTLEQSVQRVDNYAAGFIRAGASAVVAEGHLGPAYYVRALLGGAGSIEQIWRGSPNRQGNELAFASRRSDGFTAMLDPDEPGSGFHRSLVTRGVSAADVRGGASHVPASALAAGATTPGAPSLLDLGIRIGAPQLWGRPVVDGTAKLVLPLTKAEQEAMPDGLALGVRWDPVDVVADPAAAAGEPGGSDPATPPEIALVVPESLGSLVEPAIVARTRSGLYVEVVFPASPGRFRLVTSLHDGHGLAYDAASQALVTPLLVTVAGPLAASFAVEPSMTLAAGADGELVVRVRNTGTLDWDAARPPVASASGPDADRAVTPSAPARLVASWVAASGAPVPPPVEAVLPIGDTLAGEEALAALQLTAPERPGDYLLVVDVVSPAHGSLSAVGIEPALVRVTVGD